MLSESHTDQQPIMAAFILSSPPLSVAGYGEGAYRGVQKAGLHSYGLFSLMVKTFCSGSSQAHCRDSAFCIHEMSKTQNRTYEGKNERGEKSEKTEQEGLAAPNSCFKELPIVIESEAISLVCGAQINEPVDQ